MSTTENSTDIDGVSRRDFLRAGGLGVVGLSGASLAASFTAASNRRAILIMMTGGVSQLETFDPKPEAPASVRGPFKSIETAVPGLRFSESLPGLAQRANRLTVIRSLTHDAAPIHETGMQILQTGRLSMNGLVFPHWGSLVASRIPGRNGVSTNVILPGLISETGVSAYRGQQSGILGTEWEPDLVTSDPADEPESIRRMYGHSEFGNLLLKARQQIEQGTRCVTVNLFDSLKDRITWDCHGDKRCSPATLFDYQAKLCPEFDQAMSGLLDDLAQRGLLDDTLVIATGEFGRTPYVNENMGRDHWTGCWSGIVAGGKVSGGKVIGSSNASAAEPTERPVDPGELTATLLQWCGVDGMSHHFQAGGQELHLVPHAPLTELWN
ncbi:DUF1501 domain-containing protein [Schlesneria sp. T3-172]|uniref:DUF1501 domain-containing protein n=1 Tax=Schlesneria sphaerica TaxID=3373610 RepID=UPI0037C746E8